MAIAKSLPDIDKRFMQTCPFCGRSNRMIVKGVFKNKDNHELYPDMGYSFCNCKAVFYTDYKNINIHTHAGIQYYEKPLWELQNIFESLPNGAVIDFTVPDPFFIEWDTNPYTFEHFNPRFNHVIFDLDQLEQECERIGFEVIGLEKNFDVNSETPKSAKVILRKP